MLSYTFNHVFSFCLFFRLLEFFNFFSLRILGKAKFLGIGCFWILVTVILVFGKGGLFVETILMDFFEYTYMFYQSLPLSLTLLIRKMLVHWRASCCCSNGIQLRRVPFLSIDEEI